MAKLGDGSRSPKDQLKSLIEELNRQAMADDEFSAAERSQIRELLPQIREMLESRRRWLWLAKCIGAFLLSIPALAAFWSAILKLMEWIRSS